MYDYGYGYQTPDYNTVSSIAGGIAAIGAIITIISLILSIVLVIAQWKIYTKAGKPGWASIVPIYNFIVLLEIVELPMWYIVLLFIPFANIYVMFKIFIELAHKYGKTTGFGIATIFFSFVCLPILAFSKNCVYNSNTNNNQINNNFQNPQQTNNNGMNYQNNFNNIQNNNVNNDLQQPLFNQNIDTSINQIQQPQTNSMNYNIQPNQNNNVLEQTNIIPTIPNIEKQQMNITQQLENNQQESITNANTMPTTEIIGSVSKVNTIPQIQESQVNSNVNFEQNNHLVEQPQNIVTTTENLFKNEEPVQTIQQTNIIPTIPNVIENQAPIVEQPQVNIMPNIGITPQQEVQQPNVINNQNNSNIQ